VPGALPVSSFISPWQVKQEAEVYRFLPVLAAMVSHEAAGAELELMLLLLELMATLEIELTALLMEELITLLVELILLLEEFMVLFVELKVLLVELLVLLTELVMLLDGVGFTGAGSFLSLLPQALSNVASADKTISFCVNGMVYPQGCSDSLWLLRR
jgi:hypothetical protein